MSPLCSMISNLALCNIAMGLFESMYLYCWHKPEERKEKWCVQNEGMRSWFTLAPSVSILSSNPFLTLESSKQQGLGSEQKQGFHHFMMVVGTSPTAVLCHWAFHDCRILFLLLKNTYRIGPLVIRSNWLSSSD